MCWLVGNEKILWLIRHVLDEIRGKFRWNVDDLKMSVSMHTGWRLLPAKELACAVNGLSRHAYFLSKYSVLTITTRPIIRACQEYFLFNFIKLIEIQKNEPTSIHSMVVLNDS